jgi:purine-nucleoside phosphorylase
MSEFITLEDIDRVTAVIRGRTSHQSRVGIILGSGLSPLADEVENADIIPHTDLAGWPVSTVHGHEGRLVIGNLEGQPVFVMQGRSHYYEGYSMSQIGLPVRVMNRLGIEILIVTNAAGGINPEYQPGDLMRITDHLNLLGMAGPNPLRGPNLDEFGPRFPDMSQVYDRDLGRVTREAASTSGIQLREGVYVCLAGPSFESPADLRFLRAAGADAVGMSTVPEAIVARHGGMRVLGISGISNKANLDGSAITTHEEVLEAGRVIVPRLLTLIKGVLRRI